jgi:hypothetical protein
MLSLDKDGKRGKEKAGGGMNWGDGCTIAGCII